MANGCERGQVVNIIQNEIDEQIKKKEREKAEYRKWMNKSWPGIEIPYMYRPSLSPEQERERERIKDKHEFTKETRIKWTKKEPRQDECVLHAFVARSCVCECVCVCSAHMCECMRTYVGCRYPAFRISAIHRALDRLTHACSRSREIYYTFIRASCKCVHGRICDLRLFCWFSLLVPMCTHHFLDSLVLIFSYFDCD